MVEVALFTIRDISLLVVVVLCLILIALLLTGSRFKHLWPYYWLCVAGFFVAGVLRMFLTLVHLDLAFAPALRLVAGNLLFTLACLLFVLTPVFLSRLKKSTWAGKSFSAHWFSRNAQNNLSGTGNNAGPETLGESESRTLAEDLPLAEKLTEFMEQKKPYLEPHITVERLALKLNVSPKLLSGTINSELRMNFFELISNYRVLEAKKRLADGALREKPICEIMKSCGFNSKSVFNQAFKKSVGVTPSHYRQQHSNH